MISLQAFVVQRIELLTPNEMIQVRFLSKAMGKFKKFVFPGATLLFSLWVSAIFALGIVIGYFSTYIFDIKITKKEKIKMIKFNIGKWRLHIHHWLMGAVAFLVCWVAGVLGFIPVVILGMAGGIIAHDLHLDNNWHKIIMKKE